MPDHPGIYTENLSQKTKTRLSETVQGVKMLEAKPGDLNLIPGTHMVKRLQTPMSRLL